MTEHELWRAILENTGWTEAYPDAWLPPPPCIAVIPVPTARAVALQRLTVVRQDQARDAAVERAHAEHYAARIFRA